MLIVEGAGLTLLGCMEQLRLDWCNICEMKEDQLQEIMAKHEDVFKPELGKLQGFQAKLHVQEGVTPNSTKPDPYCTR